MNHIYYDVQVDTMPANLQPSTSIENLLAVCHWSFSLRCVWVCETISCFALHMFILFSVFVSLSKCFVSSPLYSSKWEVNSLAARMTSLNGSTSCNVRARFTSLTELHIWTSLPNPPQSHWQQWTRPQITLLTFPPSRVLLPSPLLLLLWRINMPSRCRIRILLRNRRPLLIFRHLRWLSVFFCPCLVEFFGDHQPYNFVFFSPQLVKKNSYNVVEDFTARQDKLDKMVGYSLPS